jgi:hypothetical protein
MLGQAAGFAFLAAMSPTALLVMAVFLGSANPRQTALAYVAGAIVMSVAMAVTLLVVIRVAGLDQPRQHDPRYDLRLAIGVLALAAAVVVIRRRPRPAGSGRGLMTRLIASPSAGSAFVAGLILFAPSATFIAAIQVVATARARVPGTVVGLVVVVIVSVLIVWLPLLAFLAAPEATTRRLSALNSWLRARGKLIAACALAVGGVILIINGILGLTST